MVLSQTNAEGSPDEKRDNLIFELIKKRLDNEWDRTKNLDNKAGNLIGFISVVVGLLLGAGTFKVQTLLTHIILSIPYFVGVGLLLISIGFALSAFRVRNWVVVPNVQTLIEKYTLIPYNEVLKRNAGEMAKAVVKSEKENDNKASLLKWCWYLLISGLGMMFIFIIVHTISTSNIK